MTYSPFHRRRNRRRYSHGGESLTSDEWAEKLGITRDGFTSRLRTHGPDDPRTFAPAGYVPEPVQITWQGVTRTSAQWAAHLGISAGTLSRRLSNYGPEDPRTWHVGQLSRGRPSHPWLRESVAGSLVGLGYPVTACEEELNLRAEVLDAYLEAFPWLASNSPHLRVEGRAVCASICRVLGTLSIEEVGYLFGVSRQRAAQLEDRALKKCKLAGGFELREAWEYAQANWTTCMSDWIEQGALGAGVA